MKVTFQSGHNWLRNKLMLRIVCIRRVKAWNWPGKEPNLSQWISSTKVRKDNGNEWQCQAREGPGAGLRTSRTGSRPVCGARRIGARGADWHPARRPGGAD